MSLIDSILGRPFASREARAERVDVARGVSTFGLDALSSAAYGPEAALTVLLPLGAAASGYIVSITSVIIVLLAIVFLSYMQTIAEYPSGGGSYTVAKQNLGSQAGLLAAAALMADYVLNVAVGISAGVGAVISAVPGLQPYTLALCLAILMLLTLVNLRGIREAGLLFIVPTCMFALCMLAVLGWGVVTVIASGGQPRPISPLPRANAAIQGAGIWILLRAFASGCTAMTGVEAVSNGVQAFRDPVIPAARRTLATIIMMLMVMLLGIAYLAHSYGITATEPGTEHYQSVLSQLIGAVAGRGAFYRVSIVSIVLVLCLSANTSFADFPRLCRTLAEDGYLPRSMSILGRRLVYTEGICVLAMLAGILLIAFEGVTDRLIPLFAVGAFLAFTLSQSGMVMHWRRSPKPGALASMAVNGLGAAATAATTVTVILVKFIAGAWMVVLLVPSLIALMIAVKRHYRRIEREISGPELLSRDGLQEPIVIVPIDGWTRIAANALSFALTISGEIEALHIEHDKDAPSLKRIWTSRVEEPARRANRPVPRLTTLQSPYRFVIQPIIDHVLEVERRNPNRTIAVLLPELVEARWYNYFLHNQRAKILGARLMAQRACRIVIVKVPWYASDWAEQQHQAAQPPPVQGRR